MASVFHFYGLESPEFRKAVYLSLGAASLGWMFPACFRGLVLATAGVFGLFLFYDARAAIEALGLIFVLVFCFRSGIGFWGKAILLVGVVCGALVSRASLPGDFLLIIGVALMFRSFLYLFESRHSKAAWSETLAYFLLLPSFVLPFFPVVGFSRFMGGVRAPRDFRMARRGMGWIANGLVQLIVYRVVVKEAMLFPFLNVVTVGDALHSMFLGSLRCLHVSGSFQIAIGLLLVFGVDLPRPSNNYFFARGIADYWGRFNIYWKDFVTRAVFFPSYIRLRRRGKIGALFVATILTFLATWALHSYIYLWIRGEFPFDYRDCAYWSGLALCLFVGFLGRGGVRRERGEPLPPILALQIAGTFLVTAFLWLAWNVGDFRLFCNRMTRLHWSGFGDLIWLLPFVATGALGAVVYSSQARRKSTRLEIWPGAFGAVTLVALVVAGLPPIVGAVARSESDARWLVQAMIEAPLAGFQESEAFFEGRWAGLPKDWGAPIPVAEKPTEEGIEVRVPDYRIYEYRPNSSAMIEGARFYINRWGMQDKDHPLAKRVGTIRVALVGASVCLPVGVKPEEGWADIAEKILNQGRADTVEIMNFGVYGYSPLLFPYLYEKKVVPFKPDVLLLELEMSSFERTGVSIAGALHRHLEFPYPELFPLIGVSNPRGLMAGFYPIASDFATEVKVVDWSIQKLAELADRDGIRKAMVNMPAPMAMLLRPEPAAKLNARLVQAAERNGFDVVDLSSTMDHVPMGDVLLPSLVPGLPYDVHFNRNGHKQVAEDFAKGFAPYLARTFPLQFK